MKKFGGWKPLGTERFRWFPLLGKLSKDCFSFAITELIKSLSIKSLSAQNSLPSKTKARSTMDNLKKTIQSLTPQQAADWCIRLGIDYLSDSGHGRRDSWTYQLVQKALSDA